MHDLKKGIIDINGVLIDKDYCNDGRFKSELDRYDVKLLNEFNIASVGFWTGSNKVVNISFYKKEKEKKTYELDYLKEKLEKLKSELELQLQGIYEHSEYKEVGSNFIYHYDFEWGDIELKIFNAFHESREIILVVSFYEIRKKEQTEIIEKFKKLNLYKSSRKYEAYYDRDLTYTAKYEAYGYRGSILTYYLINEDIFNELIDNDTTDESIHILMEKGTKIYSNIMEGGYEIKEGKYNKELFSWIRDFPYNEYEKRKDEIEDKLAKLNK